MDATLSLFVQPMYKPWASISTYVALILIKNANYRSMVWPVDMSDISHFTWNGEVFEIGNPIETTYRLLLKSFSSVQDARIEGDDDFEIDWDMDDGDEDDGDFCSVVEDTISVPPSAPKSFVDEISFMQTLKAVSVAIGDCEQGEVWAELEEVKLLAQGGYNDIWLVSFTTRYSVSIILATIPTIQTPRVSFTHRL